VSEYWGVARTHPTQEPRAIVNLQRQNFECFFPFYTEARGKYRKLKIVPIFPSYVFIKLNDEISWAPVNNTYGIK
jgi:hypothetical protein